ncbi:ABC transporter ATP-binding protein [Ligilactobacillus ceti]|uniref:ABC superfamily ATP binding cassette transporter, ABC protein n=1 Tax=Ligilactobacillus ceti DSM 22408 TaxID=1122146 RepID=A0A0R2KJU1_9LACO|nr:ABC transporter ATP-binding protein [Ligilactobacillus ceti]KRN89631.1 ABC superfamily ATP binding cassette transporter, ABC protein [Ligilactobacillus ceti DSM 22408]
MPLLTLKNIQKIYGSKLTPKIEALKNVSFTVEEGEFIAIMGESGSGKSTLLNLIATLDTPSAGEIILNETPLHDLKSSDISAFRRNKLGFVFQDFNLLNTFTNRDNIYLPLVLSGFKPNEMAERLTKIAPTLGITEILDRYPYESSGGQQQRVAIARAIITQPELLLADEPTGALDSRSSKMIMNLFQTINQQGQTVLMVTHSTKAAAHAKRVLFIKDGIVFHEIYKGDDSYLTFMEKINEMQILLDQGGVNNEL